MGEPYRTLLGHFRHEVGHHYWDLLVRDAGRRIQGCPPAQLDDAVQSLLEQIGRVNNVALHQH